VIAISAILLASLLAPPQERRDTRPPGTDQTVSVTRGTRLLVENFAGEVIIRAWDRDSVRVQARHASRAKVTIRTVPTGLRISSSAEHGPPGSVDYEINAPAWMPLKIDGQYNFVTVEGSQADVSIETVHGDIVVKGGNGVTAKSVEGDITVEGAKGKINVSSVNEGITINGSSGEIYAETVNGPIALFRSEAANLEASTINGNITYDGAAVKGGRYRLTSHNGGITVAVPESSSATFAIRTYNGGFNSTLPVKGEREPREIQKGRRGIFTLGDGSAEFELESFSGGIRLRKPGTIKEK
jgi:DUF4097 and DUF4098 domain-containing protein YvlB